MLSKSYASVVTLVLQPRHCGLNYLSSVNLGLFFFPFGTTTSKQMQLLDRLMDGREDDRRFPLI